MATKKKKASKEKKLLSDKLIPSDEVLKQVADENCPVVLRFSRGKDSLACWHRLKDFGMDDERLFVYTLLSVPGLSFVEDYLDYVSEKMGKPITRLPSAKLYKFLMASLFQPPGGDAVVEAAAFPDMDIEMLTDWYVNWLVDQDSISPKEAARVAVAQGIKFADGWARQQTLRDYGSWDQETRTFYPVWDFNKDQIVKFLSDKIVAGGPLLASDYRRWGRSFDGIYAMGFREYTEAEREEVARYFPLAFLQEAREQYAAKKYGVMGGSDDE